MATPDISHLFASRQLAIENGHMYYLGSICRRKHDGIRYSKTNHCVKCTMVRISTKEMIEYKKQYRQSKEGKEVANLYNKLYYQKNREKEIKRSSEYAKKNPGKNILSQRRNKEKRYKYTKEWRLNNREKCRSHETNRRARKINADGSYTSDQALVLLAAQNYKCVNCKCCIKERSSRHLDHIMPLALGGSNDIKNLQWLCAKCNLSKKDKHPIEWAQRNGRLL